MWMDKFTAARAAAARFAQAGTFCIDDALTEQPARVTAHSVPTDAYPDRTTILIKLDRTVIERETAMGGP